MMSMVANLASITSRTSMSVVIVGGVVSNTLIQQCLKSNDLTKKVFGNLFILVFFFLVVLLYVVDFYSQLSSQHY